ncbi:MAG: tRNA (adenosine(37)-N6)-dimethylallyltransferase MiaA [Candidatus Delongbacteria bacterium]|nr:tRNA (adenosine(37)-N6)-dimethylallyltransferase MiaA [Candidatus Delongbacteria bacterium]
MNKLLVITGPTAVGKTGFAVNLCRKLRDDFNLRPEIISADSRQVYKFMDIGTGKDLAEYGDGDDKIPYHLIDIREPGYEYNVYEFRKDFIKVFYDITSRGGFPVLCGGTGLYIEAVLENHNLVNVPPDNDLRAELEVLSKEELIERLSSFRTLHNTSDTESTKRLIRAIEIETYMQNNNVEVEILETDHRIIGITGERINVKKNITKRLSERLENGMIEEAQKLLELGVNYEQMEYYGLEYKHLSYYLKGECNLNDMKQRLNSDMHRFSKRQMTWFRHMEKNGHNFFWINFEKSIKNKLNLAIDHLLEDGFIVK